MIFKRPSDFSKQLMGHSLQTTQKTDSFLKMSSEDVVSARRVSVSNPSQKMHQAYATVLKHKRILFKPPINRWNNTIEYLDRSVSTPDNFTKQDHQPSFYPNASLNPELRTKIKMISVFNKSKENLRREKCFSSPKHQKRIRKGSPIKIHSISPNIAVSLLKNELRVKCSECGLEKCACNQVTRISERMHRHENNKDTRRIIKSELENYFDHSNESKFINTFRPATQKVFRAISVDSHKVYNSDIDENSIGFSLNVSVSPVTLHRKSKLPQISKKKM